MMNNWTILHRKNLKRPLSVRDNKALAVWSTCQREIGFYWSEDWVDDYIDGDDIHVGFSGLQFLTEVISGLHSELIGETEVQGQFKQFIETDLSKLPQFSVIKPWLQKVLTLVKNVRSEFFCGTGVSSYGGLARDFLDNQKSIHIFGNGSLVQGMMPWLEEAHVQVYARNPKAVSSDFQKFSNVQLCEYAQAQRLYGALIIAAPMKARDIRSYLKSHNLSLVLDFRGESAFDPILLDGVKIVSLHEMWTLLEEAKAGKVQQKEKALNWILNQIEQLEAHSKVRPFGWDDLCA